MSDKLKFKALHRIHCAKWTQDSAHDNIVCINHRIYQRCEVPMLWTNSGMPFTELNDNTLMPAVGFGTYQIPNGADCESAVLAAIQLGYRSIDTAHIYGNEEAVGNAIKGCGIPRASLFITTKLWNTDQGFDNAIAACEKSLRTLDLEYIDQYLIHWPVPYLRDESWRALILLKERGLCRSIGVSNYTVAHLEALLAWSAVTPAVNQVELSPFLYQKHLLDFCKEHSINVVAYSPLTRGRRLSDTIIELIAREHQRTPAEILLRWVVQRGAIPLVKSTSQEHLKNNLGCIEFELSEEEMASLDSLNEGYRTCWDPSGQP
jgi:diketogulonate reductase-like aldo/keto reductase